MTGRSQAEATLHQQTEQEQLIWTIAQQIQQLLSSEQILNTAVTGVRQCLQLDRVIIYRFEPGWAGTVVAESVDAAWVSMLGERLQDPCLCLEMCIQPYEQGRFSAVANIHTAGLADCYVELLDRYQVQANLVVPILTGQSLWGLFVAQQCAAPHEWTLQDVALLQQLAVQVSIAIQQSELSQQVHRLNTELERQTEQHITQR